MLKLGPALFVSLLLLIFSVPGFTALPDADREARLLGHIAYLSIDERDGRGIGTEGLDASAAYIQRRYAEAGLLPLFPTGEDGPTDSLGGFPTTPSVAGDYFQRFEIGWGASPLPQCRFTIGEQELALGLDITTLPFSGEGEVASVAVFAGYGITAPEYDYDDYGELEATGKVVIVLDGEPAAGREEARFAGAYDTDHALWRNKAINAKAHGAAALIIVPHSATEEADQLPELRTDEPYRDAGLPVLFAKRRVVDSAFARFSLDKAQRSIDLNESPRSMPLGETAVQLTVALEVGQVQVANVGAALPGDDRLLIVGAHYDHLGYGQVGSNEYGVRAVHNGADDNASGVAVLLELARSLAQSPPGPTVWFVAFTAEEVGLLGSSYFVQHAPEGLTDARFMLNLDMVGRMEEDRLTFFGVNSADGLREAANAANEALEPPLQLALTGGGYGASDQTSFYSRGIPVGHLLTALHADYHSPRDDIALIHGGGLVRVCGYAESLLRTLASDEYPLTYKEGEPPEKRQGRGVPVSMGTIPDFSAPDSLRGMRIQGVQPGSPADKAGLTGQDVLLQMGDVLIDNIYDFTYALRQHVPGDAVEVVFKRGGEEKSTTVTLAPSSRGGHGGGGHPGGKGDKPSGGHPGGGDRNGHGAGHPGGSQ